MSHLRVASFKNFKSLVIKIKRLFKFVYKIKGIVTNSLIKKYIPQFLCSKKVHWLNLVDKLNARLAQQESDFKTQLTETLKKEDKTIAIVPDSFFKKSLFTICYKNSSVSVSYDQKHQVYYLNNFRYSYFENLIKEVKVRLEIGVKPLCLNRFL